MTFHLFSQNQLMIGFQKLRQWQEMLPQSATTKREGFTLLGLFNSRNININNNENKL